MGKAQMMMRILASESQLNMSDIRVGRIADGAWQKLFQTANAVAESPLYIDDTSGISPFEIRAKVRRLQAQRGLDMIMVDYMQIMDLKQKVESRERAVSEISKTLKQIAKEFKVPVIALAQLNRSVEGRSDRRPMLSDLRESGSIEQDADVIMMLYRDDYYERENSEQKGVAEVIIGKQRNGPTGTVKLAWFAQHGTFANLAPDSMVPPPPVRAPTNNRPSGEIPNFAPR
jgi:replicative DNA helicase